MIKNLTVTNVGPSQKLDLTFGTRLNLITGDNGLGKSFLLDLIWYAMTRQWPSEVNPQLTNSSIARPPLTLTRLSSRRKFWGRKKMPRCKRLFLLTTIAGFSIAAIQYRPAWFFI